MELTYEQQIAEALKLLDSTPLITKQIGENQYVVELTETNKRRLAALMVQFSQRMKVSMPMTSISPGTERVLYMPAHLEPVIMGRIPPYGELMTMDEFLGNMDAGCLSNDDGNGAYATATAMSNERFSPSNFIMGYNGYTHVVWFNK